MRRNAYRALLKWKSPQQRKPLLIQGARQVGKTYLVKQFGHNEYEDFAYFNFEETPDLRSLFEQSLDPTQLLQSLSVYIGRKIHPHTTGPVRAKPKLILSCSMGT